MSFDELAEAPQYSLPRERKDPLLLAALNDLTEHHQRACAPYARILDVIGARGPAASLADVPYLPAGLFKSHLLSSVPPGQVFKTMTSSGTTGQQVSQIVLDRETARRQTMALAKIITSVIGPARLPMIVVDTAALVRDRTRFSARAAGVLGLTTFGRQHFYALDDAMELDLAGLRAFLDRFGGAPFLMFGFTFMVWQYLYRRIESLGLDLSHGILFHSGGWKALQDVAVSSAEFRRLFRERAGLARIYNFYGMVEQVGSIFLEGDDGYLYPPNFADVVIRDPVTLAPAPAGVPGVIQVLSALPRSYPGHSILTEDLGIFHGVDDSSCGRYGRRFSVLGRVPRTELRGCSDVQARQAASA